MDKIASLTASSTTDAQATIIAALLAAAFAAIGFVAKLGVDAIRAFVDRRNARIASLVELDGLLRASRAVFENQNALAQRLNAAVAVSQPGLVIPAPVSFENTFVAAYRAMTASEKTNLGIIRSMTEHALRPLNTRILEWLKSDNYWRAQARARGQKGKLAQSLAELEAHLHLWQAKYSYWMTNPQHALVYLADEEAHGLGFPRGLDAQVQAMLRR